MRITRKNNKALTLIEALIWFALLAALVFFAFISYNGYSKDQKIYTVDSELQHVYKKMNTLLYSTPKTDVAKFSITKTDLIEFGVYPQNLKSTANGFTISVFGKMHIAYKNGTGQEIYSVTYYEIPKGDVCSKIIISQKSVGWTRVNALAAANMGKPASICNGTGNVDLEFWAAPYQPDTMN